MFAHVHVSLCSCLCSCLACECSTLHSHLRDRHTVATCRHTDLMHATCADPCCTSLLKALHVTAISSSLRDWPGRCGSVHARSYHSTTVFCNMTRKCTACKVLPSMLRTWITCQQLSAGGRGVHWELEVLSAFTRFDDLTSLVCAQIVS